MERGSSFQWRSLRALHYPQFSLSTILQTLISQYRYISPEIQFTWKLCLFLSCKPVTQSFKLLQVKLFVSQPSKILKASSFRYPQTPRRSNAKPGLVFVCNRCFCLLDRNDLRKFSGKIMMKASVSFRKNVSVALVRLVSVLLVSSISVVTTADSPSCKFVFLNNILNVGIAS